MTRASDFSSWPLDAWQTWRRLANALNGIGGREVWPHQLPTFEGPRLRFVVSGGGGDIEMLQYARLVRAYPLFVRADVPSNMSPHSLALVAIAFGPRNTTAWLVPVLIPVVDAEGITHVRAWHHHVDGDATLRPSPPGEFASESASIRVELHSTTLNDSEQGRLVHRVACRLDREVGDMRPALGHYWARPRNPTTPMTVEDMERLRMSFEARAAKL